MISVLTTKANDTFKDCQDRVGDDDNCCEYGWDRVPGNTLTVFSLNENEAYFESK